MKLFKPNYPSGWILCAKDDDFSKPAAIGVQCMCGWWTLMQPGKEKVCKNPKCTHKLKAYIEDTAAPEEGAVFDIDNCNEALYFVR